MTPPRTVTVGRVVLTRRSYAWFSGDNLYSVRPVGFVGAPWRAHGYGFGLYADGETPQAAADSLLRALRGDE